MVDKLVSDNKEKEKRQTRLNLRLSDLEYAFVLKRAAGFGLPLAKFVRVCLLDLPKPAKRVHDLPIINPELYRQLVSIGNNVNQLTRYAHTVSLDPKKNLDVLQLAFALEKIGVELEQLRAAYTLDKSLQDVFEADDETGFEYGIKSGSESDSDSDTNLMVEGS